MGKETAKVLLQHNATVYIACRSSDKAKVAIEELKALTRVGGIHSIIMDLSDLPSVKAGVDEFLKFVLRSTSSQTEFRDQVLNAQLTRTHDNRHEKRLDTLFNSAGVMWCPMDFLTKHGHDMQFGTNVLGHFYLTQLLLPTLISSAKSSTDGHARVVNVSSNGHWTAPTLTQGGPILYDTLSDGPSRRQLSPADLYNQSKAVCGPLTLLKVILQDLQELWTNCRLHEHQGNVLFSKALARKYGFQGMVSTSLNPGLRFSLSSNVPPFPLNTRMLAARRTGGVETDLQRHTSPLVGFLLVRHTRARLLFVGNVNFFFHLHSA